MQSYNVIATNAGAATQVAVAISNGHIPNVYKTKEECVKAYCAQPMPMQLTHVPWCVTFNDAGDAILYRLDLPTTGVYRPN